MLLGAEASFATNLDIAGISVGGLLKVNLTSWTNLVFTWRYSKSAVEPSAALVRRSVCNIIHAPALRRLSEKRS